MSILKVWQLTLILAKQDPLGRDQIEKKGFFNTLLMRKHHFWHVQWFWNGQKWGVKKASLYVHFEGLTTDSYFGKTRPPGERSDRKKSFFNTLLMRKHHFWHVQWFEMVKNGGLKKHLSMSILKVWQLTLILAKQDPLGRDQIEKKAFSTLFWWENIISDMSSGFEMVKNGRLKKHLSMSILKVWQLTLTLAKQDPLGRDQIEKKGFFNTLLIRKHHFWHVQWFEMVKNGGLKKHLSMSILKV